MTIFINPLRTTAVLKDGSQGGLYVGAILQDGEKLGRTDVKFQSWFGLASHTLGTATLTVRHDRFRTVDRDRFPADPNGESGGAWAIAYARPLPHHTRILAEFLRVDSVRDARALLGDSLRKSENRLAIELRWNPPLP